MTQVITLFKKRFFQREFLLSLLFWVFLGFIFYLNAFHEKYTDEFDNILGGWYILHGRLPYIGFFSHHGPVPYFLAAIVEIFSRHSFVRFRVVYELFLLFYFFGVITYLQRSIEKLRSSFLFVFVMAIGFIATYYWFHMLLADSLAAFFLIPVFALLLLKPLFHEKFSLSDVSVVSICSFLALLTSLTYIYLIFGVYLFMAVLLMRQQPQPIRSQFIYKAAGIFIAPYILFGVYLLLTGSFKDYYYQSIYFNQKYYVYNYPGTIGSINPIRFAIVIAHGVINGMLSLLVQVKDFNFSYPLNITFALGNVVLITYLVTKRKFSLALFSLFIVIYSNARTNPLNSGEHDYQSAVYIMYSIFVICFLLFRLYSELNETKENGAKTLFVICFVPLAIYSIFSGIFVFNKFNNRYFDKYMGNAPLVYDRPEVAPIINAAVLPQEYVWVGPLAYEDLFYINGKLASRYHVLNPGMASSPKISSEQVADLEKTQPNVIWYNPRYSILGRNPIDYATTFNEFLRKNYIAVYEYREGNFKYIPTVMVTETVDIEKYLFMRKGSERETLNRLVASNWLKKVPAK